MGGGELFNPHTAYPSAIWYNCVEPLSEQFEISARSALFSALKVVLHLGILPYIFSAYREVIIAITVSAFVVFFIPWLKKRASRGSGFHLYRLTITDTETGCWYTIGLFSGKDQAKECSEHYLNEVPGFKDKKCKTDIDEVQIFTYMGRENDFLYQIVGWNETSDGEVKDIYSLYFFTKEECIGELENIIISKNKRSQWRIVRFEVGKRYYPEGFENRE